MGYSVDNAVIMAAGLSSRLAPLSYEKPKALFEVRGEILIERQIRQLRETGIGEIVVVVGYKKEQFYYLREKYGIILVENMEFLVRNNHSSIWAARDYLKNTYICSADNYFIKKPFEQEVESSYYAAVFSRGKTKEWCLQTDEEGQIIGITIGGCNQWYMMGHTFWNREFSQKMIQIIENVYDDESTKDKLWEHIYMENLWQLKMKIKRYPQNQIYEFDSLEDLKQFDEKYRQYHV